MKHLDIWARHRSNEKRLKRGGYKAIVSDLREDCSPLAKKVKSKIVTGQNKKSLGQRKWPSSEAIKRG